MPVMKLIIMQLLPKVDSHLSGYNINKLYCIVHNELLMRSDSYGLLKQPRCRLLKGMTICPHYEFVPNHQSCMTRTPYVAVHVPPTHDHNTTVILPITTIIIALIFALISAALAFCMGPSGTINVLLIVPGQLCNIRLELDSIIRKDKLN